MKITFLGWLTFGTICLQVLILYVRLPRSRGVSQTYSYSIIPQQGHDIIATISTRDIKPELIGKSVKVTLTLEEDK